MNQNSGGGAISLSSWWPPARAGEGWGEEAVLTGSTDSPISHRELAQLQRYFGLGCGGRTTVLGWSLISAGGCAAPGTNVAQVLPDSGLYIAVFPGTGGMRIRTLQEGH